MMINKYVVNMISPNRAYKADTVIPAGRALPNVFKGLYKANMRSSR